MTTGGRTRGRWTITSMIALAGFCAGQIPGAAHGRDEHEGDTPDRHAEREPERGPFFGGEHRGQGLPCAGAAGAAAGGAGRTRNPAFSKTCTISGVRRNEMKSVAAGEALLHSAIG